MRSLVEDNLRALRQGLELIASLDAELYGDPRSCRTGATIGAHFRHVLDHYLAFFAGLEGGIVAYELRDRDPRVEHDRGFASELGAGVLRSLEALDADRPLRLACRTGALAETDDGLSATSLRRELQFLLSHTVHHYALIAAELRVRGHAVPPGFGVAPSTLGYLHGKAA